MLQPAGSACDCADAKTGHNKPSKMEK